MCEIINVQKINNQFIVDCTPCKEDFTNAKLLQIINKHKQVYTTKEFKVEKKEGAFQKVAHRGLYYKIFLMILWIKAMR